MVHLKKEEVIDYGPRRVDILDFDERVTNSVNEFARTTECEETIGATLYNVVDPVPDELVESFDAFHINPPWGQHNEGSSVLVFLQRGIQMTRPTGRGVVVIGDDEERAWTGQVLQRVQRLALDHGMIVAEMLPAWHEYHLDDAPDLQSCAMLLRKVGPHSFTNERLGGDSLTNFHSRQKG